MVRPLARAGGRESCDVTRLLQKEPLDGSRETSFGVGGGSKVFLRRVVRYVVWRHLVRLPRLTYLTRSTTENQPIERTGHLVRQHARCAIHDTF